MKRPRYAPATPAGANQSGDLLLQALGQMTYAMRALERYASATDTPSPGIVEATDELEAAIALLHRGLGL